MEYVAKLDIKLLDDKNIKQALKKYFCEKDQLKESYRCLDTECIYMFSYLDSIKNIELNLSVEIILSSDSTELKEIKIKTSSLEITSYDLEFYYLCIYKEFTKHLVCKNEILYTVRVYKILLHTIGFKGTYNVTFDSCKLSFKPLFDEKIKGIPVERIIIFDCQIPALSLESARSKAINVVNTFSSCLSVLIGNGFFDVHTKYSHFVQKSGEIIGTYFYQNAFIDSEDKLLVKDNFNGLKHFDDLMSNNDSEYLSRHIIESEEGIISSPNKQDGLEKLFLNKKIEKSNAGDYCEQIVESVYINNPIEIPRQIRKYFKSISELDSKKRKYFINSCRLHNIACTCGIYEPTLMISYMVSSIECLAKAEGLDFSSFMMKYLEKDYEKNFCDFLYGSLRSGHLHSGETYFFEYDCELDITFNPQFIKMQKIFIRAKNTLREVYIKWVNTVLLRDAL